MLDSLGDCGRADVLYNMINRTSYPSWGYMIDHGSTTIWESWSTDNKVGCELSMTMYTTVDEFFFNELAGIKGPGYFGESLFGKPGFSSAVIAPYVPEDMQFAKADIRTVYGRLASGWEKKEGKVLFSISVPGNTDAVVRLPLGSAGTVRESGLAIWKDGALISGAAGISDASLDHGTIALKIGSGDYIFEVM
jgi:alpha-L-rhamnosidase